MASLRTYGERQYAMSRATHRVAPTVSASNRLRAIRAFVFEKSLSVTSVLSVVKKKTSAPLRPYGQSPNLDNPASHPF